MLAIQSVPVPPPRVPEISPQDDLTRDCSIEEGRSLLESEARSSSFSVLTEKVLSIIQYLPDPMIHYATGLWYPAQGKKDEEHLTMIPLDWGVSHYANNPVYAAVLEFFSSFISFLIRSKIKEVLPPPRLFKHYCKQVRSKQPKRKKVKWFSDDSMDEEATEVQKDRKGYQSLTVEQFVAEFKVEMHSFLLFSSFNIILSFRNQRHCHPNFPQRSFDPDSFQIKV